jgi:hypothetical protein
METNDIYIYHVTTSPTRQPAYVRNPLFGRPSQPLSPHCSAVGLENNLGKKRRGSRTSASRLRRVMPALWEAQIGAALPY